jgi:hypothetical protein
LFQFLDVRAHWAGGVRLDTTDLSAEVCKFGFSQGGAYLEKTPAEFVKVLIETHRSSIDLLAMEYIPVVVICVSLHRHLPFAPWVLYSLLSASSILFHLPFAEKVLQGAAILNLDPEKTSKLSNLV